ncbi:MAG TPA: cation:dicarboxylase symporter family transporter [Methanocorpusculum sp.]|nr:cation:dicarboxylase symporter family transporter [Methanocorpusculum sp.]
MPPTNNTVTFRLSKDAICEISSEIDEAFKEWRVDMRGANHLHAVVENVLGRWLEGLGEGTECIFRSGKRLTRSYITLTVAGKKVNPFGPTSNDCVLAGGNSVQTLLASIGVAPTYTYANGENQITLMPKRKRINPLISLGISVFLGIAAGLGCMGFPEDVRSMLANSFVTPLFNTFIGLLLAAALPMMFLSLMWGIYSIGDTATLGSIGKRVIGRYIGRIYFTLIICTLVCAPFFTFVFSTDMSGNLDFNALMVLLFEIVPSNLIVPFTSGNSLQIIFLAVVFGIAMLVLNRKIPVIVQIVDQANSIIQLVMEWITTLLPVIIFISVLNLMLSASRTGVKDIWILVVTILLCFVLNLVIMTASLSIRRKINPLVLIKNLLPTFLISITTASSAATFTTNMEACEKKFCINKKLVNFGVPLGTAFSRPGHAMSFFCVCLFMADQYNVEMTVTWILTAIIVAGLLAVAVPPVPGGGIACYSILFMELGIPVEALGIAIVLEILLDFISTALNMTAVPVDLKHVAGRMKLEAGAEPENV